MSGYLDILGTDQLARATKYTPENWAAVVAVAADLQAEDEEGWAYEAQLSKKVDDRIVIVVTDEDGNRLGVIS